MLNLVQQSIRVALYHMYPFLGINFIRYWIRGNNENDFAAAQDAAVDVNSDEPLLTGSILTNVNGEWSQSDDRTLNALLELHKN
jgi:hypothetical protein